MRVARGVVLGLFGLLGCADEPQRGWARVEVVEDGDDGPSYAIAFADREADVCLRIGLWPPITHGGLYRDDDHVDVRGSTVRLAGGWGSAYDPSCTVGELPVASTPIIVGEVRFDDFVNTLDRARPCSVSFEFELTHDPSIYGGEGPVTHYAGAAKHVPIHDEGCPRPRLYTSELTELDAAVGVHNGLPNLVIAGWDREREVCVWARLIEGGGIEPAANDVEAPGEWAYTGLRLALIDEQACVAADFVVPPVFIDALDESVGAAGSSGRVSVSQTGADDRPCVIDVDLTLRSPGRYDWTPDDVQMHARAVPVSGCDG